MTVLPILKTIFKNLWREARFIENICEVFFCVCVCFLLFMDYHVFVSLINPMLYIEEQEVEVREFF